MNNRLLQDSDGNESSKRVAGFILLALYACIGSVVAISSVYWGTDIGINAVSIINSFGYTGTALLASGVVEKFAKKTAL